MKYMRKLLSIFLILLMITNTTIVFAETLESGNYKIDGANLTNGGQPKTSGTGNYSLLETIGDFSGDPRASSTNYQTKLGTVDVFTASVPKISCFETTSNGSSNCTSGPAYLNSGGLTRVCGPSGCYDRARFEIDTQNNPDDTLYSIQISTDNFASDIKYIDGVTKKPTTIANITIADFLTKSNWEATTTNILGLESSTTYSLRATALHGDFTQSPAGPSVNATTALPTMTYDIDIASTSGVSTESAAPYTVTFSNNSKIIQTGPTQTSDDLIWLDANTNAQGGMAILFKGLNGGLLSPTTSYTIQSATDDLDGTSEGFGLQNYQVSQLYNLGSGNGSLSSLVPNAIYTGSGNSVGIIDSLFSKVYESDGPIHTGRTSLLLKARASASAGEASDYSETITIVFVPRY